MSNDLPQARAITYLLEDNAAFIELFKRQLNRDFPGVFNITDFRDPQLFRQALSKDVNLVFLDLKLEGFNFDIYELIKFIQLNFLGIHIIVLSGYLDEAIKDELWEHEVFFALNKNKVTFEGDLKRTIDRVMKRVIIKLNALSPKI